MARPMRLLALDGGGIRGISSLLILEAIMERIKDEDKLEEMPLPCNYFDMIGGTSTGGIIAIMLGRLGMSVNDCIVAYRQVAKQAFTPRFRLDFLPGNPDGSFSASKLELAIKQVVKEQCCQEESCVQDTRGRVRRGHSPSPSNTNMQQGVAPPGVTDQGHNNSGGDERQRRQCLHEESLFRDLSCCKTVVLAMTKGNVDARPTLFRTYDTSTGFQSVKIWEAARATSAATTFFKSIKCGRDRVEFIDAGIKYNNPCEVLIEECKDVFKDATSFKILSIGTGLGDVVTISRTRASILGALKDLATSSKQVSDRLETAYEGNELYYRFNVQNGLQDVTLSDWEQASDISAHTMNYLNDNRTKIRKCATIFANGHTQQQEQHQQPDLGPVTHQGEQEQGGHANELPHGSHPPPSAAPRRTSTLANAAEIFEVPLYTNKNFVNRQDITSRLQNFLNDATAQSKTVVLHGLGGSGKTEMAINFASTYRNAYKAVFWVNGMNQFQLTEGCSRICKALDLGTATSEVTISTVQYWLTKNNDWLLVIDNVDDDEMVDFVQTRFLNVGMDGKVIITSRNRTATTKWEHIEVSNMMEAEAVTLMGNIAGSKVADAPEMTKLLQVLGYLPLAIDQAASYIHETGIMPATYNEYFVTEKARLLSKYPSTPYNVEHRENVMTTWEISFNRIQRDRPEAAYLLLLLSLLYHEEIPASLLASGLAGECHWTLNGEFEESPKDQRWIPQVLSGALQSRFGLLEAITALKKFSFVRQASEVSALSLHPLVHYWASQRLATDLNLRHDLTICAIGLVSQTLEKQDCLPPLIPRSHFFSGVEEMKLSLWPWRKYYSLRPHAVICLQHARNLSRMPECIAHFALSLLQFLDYAIIENMEQDHTFSMDLTYHLEQFALAEDGFLKLSALLWRLHRCDLCRCRKDINLSQMRREARIPEEKDRDDEYQSDDAVHREDMKLLCDKCTRVYIETCKQRTLKAPTQRTAALLETLGFRLAFDRFHVAIVPSALKHAEKLDPTGNLLQIVEQSEELFFAPPPSKNFKKYISAKSSWLQRYALSMRRYLLLRSNHEWSYKFSKTDTMPVFKTSGYIEDLFKLKCQVSWANELKPSKGEPLFIAETLRDLCGIKSEEYRRIAFYASFSLSNAAAEDLLRPLLQATIEHPVQSWAHERCIIRFTEVLVEQRQYEEAKEILRCVQESYAAAGFHLAVTDNHWLLSKDQSQNSSFDNIPVRNNIQVFVISLRGGLSTFPTQVDATVISVMTAISERMGYDPITLRLIYGGKQLEPGRFLSDYGIQNGSTLHAVLRLYGGDLF